MKVFLPTALDDNGSRHSLGMSSKIWNEYYRFDDKGNVIIYDQFRESMWDGKANMISAKLRYYKTYDNFYLIKIKVSSKKMNLKEFFAYAELAGYTSCRPIKAFASSKNDCHKYILDDVLYDKNYKKCIIVEPVKNPFSF